MYEKELKKKKVRNILVMASSQLVLTLFVGYWLNSQFVNEKKTLQDELRQLWNTARRDYVMKLIHTNLLAPVMELSSASNSTHTIHSETLNNEPLVKDIKQFIESNEEDISYLTKYLNSEYPYPEPDESVEVMITSISRIAYSHNVRTNAYPFMDKNSNPNFAQNEALFVKMFEAQLKHHQMLFSVNYIPLSTHISSTPDKLYVKRYNRDLKEFEPAASFTGYFTYLLKVITPQILFVIILLSLTGFALAFTYRSYIKQMKLNQLRSDFINNITHELKIPVATAKAALEALRKFGMQADAQTMEDYLDMMAREMNRLDQLTERVLKHSVIEKEKQHLKLEKTDLNTFISTIIYSVRKLPADIKGNIEYQQLSRPVYSYIDQVYVEGIIKNLIDNSIKYGGSGVKIKIELKESTRYAIIKVSDNGPGIKKEYLDKVFDKFFRIPTDNKHNVKGFGLGLSFAALLVHQHKGTIDVKNRPEGGCVFTIKLPKEQSS
ncbi:sensor histidine kinase [Carboxylicivirga taeanensis]|uniref:sensor histidine kinase n=1 Tax=Carboxylicivirga taeanensis TaxID=1416875 RepID=UPI003F6DF62B